MCLTARRVLDRSYRGYGPYSRVNPRSGIYPLPVSLLAIDLMPPAFLRLAAPLWPFEPLRDLPALPRSSDFSSRLALSNTFCTPFG